MSLKYRVLFIIIAPLFLILPFNSLKAQNEPPICCVVFGPSQATAGITEIVGCIPYSTTSKCVDFKRRSLASEIVGSNDISCSSIPECHSKVLPINLNVAIPGLDGWIKDNFSDGLSTYLKTIVELLIYLSGFLAFFMIVWGGFKWMWGAGNEELIGSAKTTIVDAVMGLLLALGAFLVLSIVNPKLVVFKEITPIKLPPMVVAGNCKMGEDLTSQCICGDPETPISSGRCCWLQEGADQKYTRKPGQSCPKVPDFCSNIVGCNQYTGTTLGACVEDDPCGVGPCKNDANLICSATTVNGKIGSIVPTNDPGDMLQIRATSSAKCSDDNSCNSKICYENPAQGWPVWKKVCVSGKSDAICSQNDECSTGHCFTKGLFPSRCTIGTQGSSCDTTDLPADAGTMQSPDCEPGLECIPDGSILGGSSTGTCQPSR